MDDKPRLHLDADTSKKTLQRELLLRGHDVTRTPNEWMPADATDEEQLLGATAQGRCIFTFNIGDFQALALRYPQHHGIILASQGRFNLGELVLSLDDLLNGTKANDWPGQVRWLNDWNR